VATKRLTLVVYLTGLAIASLLTGCESWRQYVANGFKVGPNYSPVPARVAPNWIDQADPKISSDPADTAEWWKVFGDPVLDQLIQTMIRQNLTLREAGYRLLAAQAQRQAVAGTLFPQLQELTASYNRIGRSDQTALFPRGLQVDPGTPFARLLLTEFDNFAFGGQLAWELDFWGRFRRAIEAADAQVDAAGAGLNEVRVLLVAQVAANYIELRTVEERLKVARENLKLQEESARVAQSRFNNKAAESELDLPQARANLENTRAVIELLAIQQRQAENRLAVLLGVPPGDLAALVPESTGIPKPPQAIAVGLPADLLWRRPDVRQAERLLAAQSAQIGVAVSELYPHISIIGGLSWEAATFGNLFRPGAFGGTIGPSFRWQVLNWGRLLNAIRTQEARFQELVARYQQTLLTANAEAENAIVTFLRLHQRVAALEQAYEQAREAERIGLVKYREGEIDFNRLFVLQQLLLGQQEALVGARGDLARSLVEVYRALGGGWEPKPESELQAVPRCVPTDPPGAATHPQPTPQPPMRPPAPPAVPAKTADQPALLPAPPLPNRPDRPAREPLTRSDRSGPWLDSVPELGL
jgi:NodT family efflux transporter outer membrane factor (OMF) lipoprotein